MGLAAVRRDFFNQTPEALPDTVTTAEDTPKIIDVLGNDADADRIVADATGLSRSYVQKLISNGRLTAGGAPLRANAVVDAGTELRLDVPPATPVEVAPEPEIVLTVVYEDDDLLIVDKPAGLVVHPSPGHSSGTLVNALLGRSGGTDSPRDRAARPPPGEAERRVSSR